MNRLTFIVIAGLKVFYILYPLLRLMSITENSTKIHYSKMFSYDKYDINTIQVLHRRNLSSDGLLYEFENFIKSIRLLNHQKSFHVHIAIRRDDIRALEFINKVSGLPSYTNLTIKISMIPEKIEHFIKHVFSQRTGITIVEDSMYTTGSYMKLLIEHIFYYVDHGILLDIDTVVVNEIDGLHDVFRAWRKGWMGLWDGFCTCIMDLDLKRMRNRNLTAIYIDQAKKYFESNGKPPRWRDQGIFQLAQKYDHTLFKPEKAVAYIQLNYCQHRSVKDARGRHYLEHHNCQSMENYLDRTDLINETGFSAWRIRDEIVSADAPYKANVEYSLASTKISFDQY